MAPDSPSVPEAIRCANPDAKFAKMRFQFIRALSESRLEVTATVVEDERRWRQSSCYQRSCCG